MMRSAFRGGWRAWCAATMAVALLTVGIAGSVQSATQTADAFQPLLGWWTGKGRLGFTNGKTEDVKCRATYRSTEEGEGLRQVLRCASPSGSVEIKSTILRQGDELTGTWLEQKYNFDGRVTGKIIPNGFRVFVDGSGVKANMTVVVRNERHIVEIQFVESSLIGLTMIFTRS